MAADGLVTQGVKASAAMVLIYISQNIPVSAVKELKITRRHGRILEP